MAAVTRSRKGQAMTRGGTASRPQAGTDGPAADALLRTGRFFTPAEVVARIPA